MFKALSLSFLSFKIDFLYFSLPISEMINYLIIKILAILVSISHFQIGFYQFFYSLFWK